MQRAIWIITFFIILAIGYYWLVVDDTRTQKMVQLADSDKELSGDVNSTVEFTSPESSASLSANSTICFVRESSTTIQ